MPMSVFYTSVNGTLLDENRGSEVTTFVPDTLGTHASGAVTSETSYWPYGEIASSSGTNPSPWGTCGTLPVIVDLSSEMPRNGSDGMAFQLLQSRRQSKLTTKVSLGSMAAAVLFSSLVACGAPHDARRPAGVAAGAQVPAFQAGIEYGRVKEAFESGEPKRLKALLSLRFEADGVALDRKRRDAYIERLQRLANETRSVGLSNVSCQQNGPDVACSLDETRTSTYRRTPNASFSVSHSARKDEWRWDGSSWRFQNIRVTHMVISDYGTTQYGRTARTPGGWKAMSFMIVAREGGVLELAPSSELPRLVVAEPKRLRRHRPSDPGACYASPGPPGRFLTGADCPALARFHGMSVRQMALRAKRAHTDQ